VDLLEVVRCEMLERRGVFDGELHRVDIARISVASAPTVAPMSYLASALASARTSIRIPSTLDDAIASVRKSTRSYQPLVRDTI